MKKPKFLMTVDEKIESLGFEKVKEDHHGVSYKRDIKVSDTHSYTQVVSIYYKSTKGAYILQSYDPELFDSMSIGNTCVGLFGDEVSLFNKKIRSLQKNWRCWI